MWLSLYQPFRRRNQDREETAEDSPLRGVPPSKKEAAVVEKNATMLASSRPGVLWGRRKRIENDPGAKNPSWSSSRFPRTRKKKKKKKTKQKKKKKKILGGKRAVARTTLRLAEKRKGASHRNPKGSCSQISPWRTLNPGRPIGISLGVGEGTTGRLAVDSRYQPGLLKRGEKRGQKNQEPEILENAKSHLFRTMERH